MSGRLNVRYVFVGLLLAIIGVLFVVVVRTVRLSHDMPDVAPVEMHDFDADGATGRLSEAIRFRTVSHGDVSRFDVDEFEGFIAFMQESYPRIHKRLERWQIGNYTLLFRWEGRNPDLLPGMLMGHYDVVPVEPETEEEWRYPPYSGMIADGYVWGRGAFDDKSGTLSFFEAIEYLLSTGHVPERTLYLAANHDEEVGGLRGAGQVAELLESRNVRLAFLVDEGMPIAEEILTGIESRLSSHPHTNAALRTTVAPTMFNAGVKTNVLPVHAEAVVNFRIHPNDDVALVLDYVESTISNPEVEISVLEGTREASGESDVRAVPFEQLKRSIRETFDEIPIAPSMFVAATDSRHFHGLTDNVYRFRAIRVRPDDRGRLHGTNERMSVKNYAEMIQFQIRLLLNMTS